MEFSRQEHERTPSRAAQTPPPLLVVQKKTVVGATNDPAEREADAIADAVLAELSGARVPASIPDQTDRIRRSAVVGAAGGEIDVGTERAIRSQRSGGRGLGALQPRFEAAFGADFSGVRLHVGARSDDLNDALQARAFTTGSDVFVRRDAYAPTTAQGQHLLAHELAHTVQQGAVPTLRRSTAGEGGRPLSAHGYAIARRGAAVRREPDPLAPAVDLGHGTDFKHYLGVSQGVYFTLGRHMAAAEAAKYKMAVKELQRKLIGVLGGRLKAGIIKRDGVYGKSTESGVKSFQARAGVPVTGNCDYVTWAALDAEAKATSKRGREEFNWVEDHEEAAVGPGGASGQFGMSSALDWAKKDDELVVSVAYKFIRGPGVTGASVDVATTAIKQIWNTFNIEYRGPKDPAAKKRKPKNPRIKLTFNPVDAAAPPAGGIGLTADQAVFLFKPPHPNAAGRSFADAQQNQTRSDAANWNVDDPAVLAEIAGHEFGHAIGLEDEYGRRHKDMTRLAGKVDSYDAQPTIDQVTWFKTKIATSTTAADLKAIGAKTQTIDAETQAVIAQRYRDVHAATIFDDLLAAMMRIKGVYEAQQATETIARNAKVPHYQAAVTAADTADLAATSAATQAQRAERSYTKHAASAPVTAALAALTTSATAAKTAADGTKPNHTDALTNAQSAAPERKDAEARNVKAVALAKASKRAVQKTTAAATATAKGVQAVEAATIGSYASTKQAAEKSRSEQRQARSDENDRKEAAALSLEARQAAEVARDIAIAIAARRAQVWGEIGTPSQARLDAAQAAKTATELADLEAQQATAAAEAATTAAAAAGRLSTAASRSAPIGLAAASAGVAHATAQQSRSAAWDSSTQFLAQFVARDLAVERNKWSSLWAAHAPATGVDTWKQAHLQGLSTGTMMGRQSYQQGASSPPLDHSHPLAARHVRRYAEFVMKYKPDDIWEPAHR